MNNRINKSWREQRKGVIAFINNTSESYISLWQASHTIADEFGCIPSTAKKEIKRAILTGGSRYNRKWHWADD